MKLWLARHARPLAEEGTCYGASDLAADPAATAAAARALAAVLPAGLPVTCSPLRRCRQLAAALQVVRPDLAPVFDQRLAELDFGCWEGVRWDAIARAEFERWEADFAGHRFGGHESVGELVARVASALGDARAAGLDRLWITHAGVDRAATLLLRGAGAPARAADWPRAGLAFGTARCLELG